MDWRSDGGAFRIVGHQRQSRPLVGSCRLARSAGYICSDPSRPMKECFVGDRLQRIELH